MRVFIVGALALFVVGCGAMQDARDQREKENIQEAREAYETCMTIYNSVDPDSCASYKAAWENDIAVWKNLHPGESPQPAPDAK